MIRWLTCVAVVLLFATRSPAAVTEFFNRATFNATVPGVNTFDFETGSGFPAANAPLDSINATINLGTLSGDTVVQVQNFGNGFGQAIGGSNGNAVDNFRAVVISLSAPYYAIGFDDLDLTDDEDAIIDVTFPSGTVRYQRTDPDGSFATAPFFGVWSDEAISEVRVWSADTPDGLPGTRANLIDNLAISRISVPEPSTLLLSIAVLMTVLFAANRSRALASNTKPD
jgi:hypothetical protein